MKTINAFRIIKDFSEKVEKISASLKSQDDVVRLQAGKDFLISVESLSIATALKVLAECFLKEIQNANDPIVVEMFETWSKVTLVRANRLEMLLPNITFYKEAMDNFAIFSKNSFSDSENLLLKKGINKMIEGVSGSIKELCFLEFIIVVFEMFIMPTMSVDELVLEVVDVRNLN